MTIEVQLTPEEFKRFSRFDIFRRRKMWRAPVTFASILGFCALICFLMHHVEGAVMLGTVLLIVGLGMPLSYFAAFLSSLHKQVKTLGLPKKVYTLRLSGQANGIRVENDREQADYAWKDVHHVYFGKTAAYLYMTPARAFILPYSCVEDGSNSLSSLIKKQLAAKQYSFLAKQ